MDFFSGTRHSFKLEKCFDFTQLSKGAKTHLKNVYACMTLTIAACAFGAGIYLHVIKVFLESFDWSPVNWPQWLTVVIMMSLVPLIGSIGSIFYLSATSSSGMDMKRVGCLGFFGMCNGLSIGPLLDMVIRINPAIVLSALVYTTFIFLSLTLVALYSQKRSLLYLGGFLCAGLNILFWGNMLSFFFGIRMFMGAELYLGLAIFCGFILFDTQMIIYRYEDVGERDFIWHSVDLFIDFLNVFIRLLILLSKKERKRETAKGDKQ